MCLAIRARVRLRVFEATGRELSGIETVQLLYSTNAPLEVVLKYCGVGLMVGSGIMDEREVRRVSG